MPEYHITETNYYYVEADSEKDALKQHKDGYSNFADVEIEVFLYE